MYFLGIDGGGSKTEAVLIDNNKQILLKIKGLGANYHNLGVQTTIDNICYIIQKIQKRGFFLQDIVIGLALAGLDIDLDFQTMLQAFTSSKKYKNFGFKNNFLFNDGLAGLFSANVNWGVCLISGTGSNCYGLSLEGEVGIAGDWGYLLGDQGSGFALGQKLIHHLIKVYDHREQSQGLEKIILQTLEINNVSELVKLSYTDGAKVIARAANILQDQQACQHPLVIQHVTEVAEELTSAYMSVVKQLSLLNLKFTTVLQGSLLEHQNIFSKMIKESVLEYTSKTKLVEQHNPASYGAAVGVLHFTHSQYLPERVYRFF